MIRIIGILCGSALAISLLIIVLGIPEILPPQSAAVENKELTTEPPATEPVEPLPQPEQAVSVPQTEPAAPDILEEELAEESILEERLIEERLIEESVASIDNNPAAELPNVPETSAEDNWYAFWSPFRSELAANGFVSQLQRTTGLDYRVVKVKTGVYEVAFAYADDADIETKLAAIASATGLDLPGG